jgi:Group II intron, maturase-specific domain/HNH endonuclease
MLLKSIGSDGVALYPNKDKVRDIIRRCKEVYRQSQNLSAAELISKLNPIIGGWGRYFNMENSSKYRVSLQNALYLSCWRWIYKKHPKGNKRDMARRYFLKKSANTKTGEENLSYPSYNHVDTLVPDKFLKVKNRTWVFRGESKSENRFRDEVKYRTSYLQNPTNVSPIVYARKYQLPIELRSIHAFHKDIERIKECKLKVNLLESAKTPSLKDKLFRIQKGLCSICDRPINFEMLHENYCHIHHINPIVKGGSKFIVKNLTITHAWCHRKLNHDL